MYRVKELYQDISEQNFIELMAGKEGLNRHITVPEAHRPGLSLAGYLNGSPTTRLLVFGKVEIQYMNDLASEVREIRLKAIITSETPAVFVARGLSIPAQLVAICKTMKIPLFRVNISTMSLLNKIAVLLSEAFAPCISLHGTLVEVFGMGVLIEGDAAVGKSECALALIERGHRLVSDDVVQFKKKEEGYLEGYGVDFSRYHMALRGIGIINIANLYGAVGIKEKKNLDIVVKLEVWDDSYFYDHSEFEEKTVSILGIEIPHHTLPVKPGRDVALLLETIALNYRLIQMGRNTAKEFKANLLFAMERKRKKQTCRKQASVEK